MHPRLSDLLGIELVEMEDDRAVIAEVDVLDSGGDAVAHGIGTFTSIST